MNTKQTASLLAVLVAFGGLALAADAEAHRGRPRPAIDPACARECGARECLKEAHDDAKACAEAACPSEVAVVRAACEADRRSDACREGREALRSCAVPCREALGDAKEACREERSTCLAECPRLDLRGKDRECLHACFGDARECAAPARDALRECSEGCADLKAAAREACSADRGSDACTAARRALGECRADCAAAFSEAASVCFDATSVCVDACPEASAE